MDTLSELTDGFEPHDTICSAGLQVSGTAVSVWWGEVYPGWGRTGWLGGAIPGTHPAIIPGPIISHIPEAKPTHGQMKEN